MNRVKRTIFLLCVFLFATHLEAQLRVSGNENGINLIEKVPNQVNTAVEVGDPSGAPLFIAVDDNEQFAYVTLDIDDGMMAKIDLASQTFVEQVEVADGANLIGIAINGDTAVITSGTGTDAVFIFQLSTQTLLAEIPLSDARSVAINPAGTKAYVTDDTGFLKVVDLNTNTLGTPIPVDFFAELVDITILGNQAYVTDDDQSRIYIINLDTNSVVGFTVVGEDPEGIAVTSDGALAVVANNGDGTASIVDVSNPSSPTLVASLPVGGEPVDVAISGDNQIAYVTDELNGQVHKINLTTLQIEGDPIPVGQNPEGVEIGAGLIIVANNNDGSVSLFTPNNNSASVDLGGDVFDVEIVAQRRLLPLPLIASAPSQVAPTQAAALPAPLYASIPAENKVVALSKTAAFVKTVSLDEPRSIIQVDADGKLRVWVASEGADTVEIINPETIEVESSIASVLKPRALSWNHHGFPSTTSVELANKGPSLQAVAAVPFVGPIVGVVGDTDIQWIDPLTLAIVGTAPLSGPGEDLAVGATLTVVTIPSSDSLEWFLNGNTVAAFSTVLPMGFDPSGAVYSSGLNRMYVLSRGTGVINIYDGGTGAFIETIDTGIGPGLFRGVIEQAIVAGGLVDKSLIVTNKDRNLIIEIDLLTNMVVATTSSAIAPEGIAVAQIQGFPTSGIAKSDRFFTQTDLFNEITWTAPAVITPDEYLIYRDATLTDLAGTVPGSQLFFQDHNRSPNTATTYFVVAAIGGEFFAVGSASVVSRKK